MYELRCGNLTFINGMIVFFASQCKKCRHFNKMKLKLACKEKIPLDFDTFTVVWGFVLDCKHLTVVIVPFKSNNCFPFAGNF